LKALKINENEPIRPPLSRQSVTGKNIVVFDIISSEKTQHLNMGKKFDYENEFYEVMKRGSRPLGSWL
jgi:hypothetical protein